MAGVGTRLFNQSRLKCNVRAVVTIMPRVRSFADAVVCRLEPRRSNGAHRSRLKCSVADVVAAIQPGLSFAGAVESQLEPRIDAETQGHGDAVISPRPRVPVSPRHRVNLPLTLEKI